MADCLRAGESLEGLLAPPLTSLPTPALSRLNFQARSGVPRYIFRKNLNLSRKGVCRLHSLERARFPIESAETIGIHETGDTCAGQGSGHVLGYNQPRGVPLDGKASETIQLCSLHIYE